jgi:hypothetical protein
MDQNIQHPVAVVDAMSMLACKELQSYFLCSSVENWLRYDSYIYPILTDNKHSSYGRKYAY